MRPALHMGLLLVAVSMLAAGVGYWSGTRATSPAAPMASTAPVASASQKILYYRNPMGLADTSPTPKKDPMGMDYLPVYAEEQSSTAASPAQITISPEKVQQLGVRTEAATRRVLVKPVRAVGRIEPDERRIYAITPKFEGYIERLHVNATGQSVSKGQPLFEVYSPELVAAQREYVIAARSSMALTTPAMSGHGSTPKIPEASLTRLKNWGISDGQLNALVASGDVQRTLVFHSPVSGIVTEKKALHGMRFLPGDMLYQVTDLSSVWVIVDIAEQDIHQISTGNKARIRINAYPDNVFEGRVTYLYPALSSATRTVPVRMELANPGQLLKPGMFAQVDVMTTARTAVVTVPTSAVMDSGIRRIVFVQIGNGRFEPREVTLGQRNRTHAEVLTGVREGEQVVVSANFLMDAESNLKAVINKTARTAPSSSSPAKTTVGHQAEGTVDSIDAAAGTLSITHGPVASLGWPGMTMDFVLAHSGLLTGIAPGAVIRFEFVERQPGEWVITSIRPVAPASSPHAGH
jgi:multidrug efflux pump subunit AcrA (membrane-fusion protein)